MKFTYKKRNNRGDKKKLLSVGILFVLALFGFLVFKPIIARAEAKYLHATIKADNGEIDFSPGIDNAVADFSYTRSGSYGATSVIYDAKIAVNDLSSAESDVKKLTISLPLGMAWVDDASEDKNLRTQLDTSKGVNGIEKTSIDHEAVLGWTFADSGSRTYYMSDGTDAVTVNIKVRLDTVVDLTYIEDAITATLDLSDYSETAKVNVNAPTNESVGGAFFKGSFDHYVKAGTVYDGNENYNKLIRASYVDGVYNVSRLVQEARLYLHVDKPEARIELSTDDTHFAIDDSGAADGDYVIYYRPTVASNAEFNAPWKITIPESMPGNTVVTIVSRGETDHWQPDGSTKTIEFRNQQRTRITTLSSGENVTVGLSSLDPSFDGTAFDVDASTRVFAAPPENETGILGYGYINNRGAEDSKPKTIRIKYDTDILAVMGFRLACTPGGSISKVHIKTVTNIEKDVDVNKTCNEYGVAGDITYEALGLERTDYLSEVEYELGVIPAGVQIRNNATEDVYAIVYYGARLSNERDAVSTVEIFNTDDAAYTTGVAKIVSKFVAAASLDVSAMPTQVIEAGKSLNFSAKITPYSSATGYMHSTLYPIIYIRQETRDRNGNFLPISNLKIKNGDTRGNEDITEKFGQVGFFDTDTARVYVIDGRNVADGSANVSSGFIDKNGNITVSRLEISYSIETNQSTPDQVHNVRDMIFVQSAGIDDVSTHQSKGDIYNITNGTSGGIVYSNGTNYYQIRGSQSIAVDDFAKHANSSVWLKWSEGANPIAIGTSEASLLDMNMQLVNNSGVEVPGPTTVYMPVPKRGENWGNLNYEGEDFGFSTALTGPLANPNSNVFEIFYGKNITPTSDGASLEDKASQFTSDVSAWSAADWKAVNCIKIVARNIPVTRAAANVYDFVYSVRAVDADDVEDGATDTWRPIYYQQLTNSNGDTFAGWYNASYISIRLADNKINGQLFVDANENGKFDSDERALKESGWKVELYDRDSNQLVQTVTTDANGKYEFIELLTADYYINVVNKHPISYGVNGGYLFTKKGTVSNAGSYNTDNQAVGSRTSSPMHATGYISPVTPSRGVNEATYNVGVISYIANTNWKARVSFDDNDNQSGNRPNTVKITAKTNAMDDVERRVGVGDTDLALPLYSTTGEKLEYSFTVEDVKGYDKTVDIDGDVVVVKYTEKTAKPQTKATITAPSSIETTDTAIDYTIDYTAEIENYIGEAEIMIAAKLPREIDEEASDLNGGVYDAATKKISWTINVPRFVSYDEEGAVKIITQQYNLSLAYVGVDSNDSLTVELDTAMALSVSRTSANDDITTKVRIPSRIYKKYVDEQGNELADGDVADGFIGDSYMPEPKQISGYTLISDAKSYEFKAEEQTIVFVYRKAENPLTVDNIVIWVAVLATSAAILGGLKMKCWR